jgi:hypothetical protein
VAEVEEAVRRRPWRPAELGRTECRKDFAFGLDWNGKVYAIKQVRPVFVEEANEIVAVTVYTSDAAKRFGDRETFRTLEVEGVGPEVAALREKPLRRYGS